MIQKVGFFFFLYSESVSRLLRHPQSGDLVVRGRRFCIHNRHPQEEIPILMQHNHVEHLLNGDNLAIFQILRTFPLLSTEINAVFKCTLYRHLVKHYLLHMVGFTS